MSWEGFIEQARRSLSDPDFGKRERAYKLEIAESLRGVLEAAERDEDWRTELRRALGRTYGIQPFRSQYSLSRFSQPLLLIADLFQRVPMLIAKFPCVF